MMRRRTLLYIFLVLFGSGSATAQQRPIYDPDDFVDPRQHDGAVFASRIIIGGATNLVDDYRPLHKNAGFAEIANSFYWWRFQFDYKHSEVRSTKPPPVLACGCSPPVYFPTPPLRDSTPLPPAPGSKETAQFAYYRYVEGEPAEPPVALRYRLSWSWQPIDITVTSAATGQMVLRLSGREQSLGLDADTYFRIGGHNVFGSLLLARTARTGTTDNRAQNELAYMSRFPGMAFHSVLLRATLTVGAVSGRGATGLNVVNPAFEAFWHNSATKANLHVVWSPQATRSGTAGWETHQQVAVFVDRALYVKLFRPRTRAQ